MTSSGHTGERAIHSSDFSAFTKRSHYPSLLRFLTQLTFFAIIHLHFGDCLSGTLFSSRFMGFECNLWESPSHNPPLSAWGVWKGVIHFLPRRAPEASRSRGLSWIRDLGFGCLARGDGEWADRPRLFSPSLTRACARKFTGWIHAGLSVS